MPPSLEGDIPVWLVEQNVRHVYRVRREPVSIARPDTSTIKPPDFYREMIWLQPAWPQDLDPEDRLSRDGVKRGLVSLG